MLTSKIIHSKSYILHISRLKLTAQLQLKKIVLSLYTLSIGSVIVKLFGGSPFHRQSELYPVPFLVEIVVFISVMAFYSLNFYPLK